MTTSLSVLVRWIVHGHVFFVSLSWLSIHLSAVVTISKLVERLNAVLDRDGYTLAPSKTISGYFVYRVTTADRGVSGAVKNLVFAVDGPKPDIVLSDAINNDIVVVRNDEYCLVYERPIQAEGLLWRDLLAWWIAKTGEVDDTTAARSLYSRLLRSLAGGSDAEKVFFTTYYREFKDLGERLPALVPQVYLHYDPFTIRELRGQKRLGRQRMDFLFLFSATRRVVMEIDGAQHFSIGERASLPRYAQMVSEDRALRLAGYEVFRFGANELFGESGKRQARDFFQRLLRRHAIIG